MIIKFIWSAVPRRIISVTREDSIPKGVVYNHCKTWASTDVTGDEEYTLCVIYKDYIKKYGKMNDEMAGTYNNLCLKEKIEKYITKL